MNLFIFEFGLGFYLLFWPVMLVLLIYLVVRRNRIKKTENFEDRDN